MSDDSKSWKDEKKKIDASAADEKKSNPKPAVDKQEQAAAKPEATAEQPATPQATPAQPAAPAQPATPQPAAGGPAPSPVGRQQVDVDDSDVNVCYANFCRVTGTPEELIIDFGLNTQPYGAPVKGIKVRDRIVTNMYTAKRMLHALHMTIQRHEKAFGVLETDVQKRVVATPGVGQAPRA